jgi:membrane protein required for colicin V production
METYDLIMIGVLLAATAFGAWRGFAWQLASLAAIGASCFVAYRYRGPVAAWIPFDAPWHVFLAMFLLFSISSLGIWFVFRLVARLIDRVKLKQLDHQVGAVLGFAKGLLWCLIITLFGVTLLGEKQRQAIVHSWSGFYIAKLLDKSDHILPEEIHDVLGPILQKLEDQFDGSESAGIEQGGRGKIGDVGAEFCDPFGASSAEYLAASVRPSLARIQGALNSARSRPVRGAGGTARSPYFPRENGVLTEHKKHYRTLQRGKDYRPFGPFVTC